MLTILYCVALDGFEVLHEQAFEAAGAAALFGDGEFLGELCGVVAFQACPERSSSWAQYSPTHSLGVELAR